MSSELEQFLTPYSPVVQALALYNAEMSRLLRQVVLRVQGKRVKMETL